MRRKIYDEVHQAHEIFELLDDRRQGEGNE